MLRLQARAFVEWYRKPYYRRRDWDQAFDEWARTKDFGPFERALIEDVARQEYADPPPVAFPYTTEAP